MITAQVGRRDPATTTSTATTGWASNLCQDESAACPTPTQTGAAKAGEEVFGLGPLTEGQILGVAVAICALGMVCLIITVMIVSKRRRKRRAAEIAARPPVEPGIPLRNLDPDDPNKPPAPAYGDFDSSVMVQEGPPPDYDEQQLLAIQRGMMRDAGRLTPDPNEEDREATWEPQVPAGEPAHASTAAAAEEGSGTEEAHADAMPEQTHPVATGATRDATNTSPSSSVDPR